MGWSMFAIVWSLTIIGVLFKIFFVHRYKIISIIAYILMGWLVIFAIKPLFQALPGGGLALLVCGGLAYTLELFFMHGRNFHLITQFGIYLSLPAAFVISAPLCFTSSP
jgi:hemolysin III